MTTKIIKKAAKEGQISNFFVPILDKKLAEMPLGGNRLIPNNFSAQKQDGKG